MYKKHGVVFYHQQKDVGKTPKITLPKYLMFDPTVLHKDESTPEKNIPLPIVNDMEKTLEVMSRMERAKRRGYIQITREAILSGLVDKLLSVINVIHKEYDPMGNRLNVYFEHEALAIVEEGCMCPCYTVQIEKDSGRWLFKFFDYSGKAMFMLTSNVVQVSS